MVLTVDLHLFKQLLECVKLILIRQFEECIAKGPVLSMDSLHKGQGLVEIQLPDSIPEIRSQIGRQG